MISGMEWIYIWWWWWYEWLVLVV